ncbi:two-component regulator propeller domain-containing protein [Duganella fentianensis]|uniref:two-component regulator propeller domain-containing protein n=1 Tax=Duganella fentianensis TaxID=2692177 RepID=UPI0032B19968
MAGYVARVLVLLSLFWTGASLALAAPLSLRFEHLGVEQGLTQETVTAILQDKQGYLWLGTQAGLNRYDGYRITAFKNTPNDSASLQDNYIQALYEDAQGAIWVGSRGGLDRYDAATRTFAHLLGRERSISVTAIISDGKQGLWLATTGNGLLHFDIASGEVQSYRHADHDATSIIHDRVNVLQLDRAGQLWIGTDAGLDMLPAGASRFEHITMGDGSNPATVIQAITLSSDGVLWVGSRDGLQAWRLQGSRASRMTLGARDDLHGERVEALLIDRDGVLWAGTYENGLKRRNTVSGGFYSYRHVGQDRHSLGDNQVNSLYQDRTGTLWIGNWYNGLDRVDLRSGGFEHFSEQSGVLPNVSNNKVRAIVAAGPDQVWMATARGLTLVDLARGTSKTDFHDEHDATSLPSNEVLTLDTDTRGRLWVGTVNGLAWRDPRSGRYTRVELDTLPESRLLQRVLAARDGTVWAASRAGLHRIAASDGAVTSWHHQASDPDVLDGRIYALLEDRQGKLWIGTQNGLDCFDPATGSFRNYRHVAGASDSLIHSRVHHLYEDEQGRLWIGTAAGLSVAERAADGALHFRTVPMTAARAADPIGGILGDQQGRLWISTTAGLTMLDPRSGAFREYTARDGLINGSYFIGSAYKGPDNMLYFGGLSGVTAFNPANIHGNPDAPVVVVTDFLLFNRSILSGTDPRTRVLPDALTHGKALTLDYRDTVFSIEFAALHFADPGRNLYAYKLEGFDPEWLTVDAGKRYVTYTNLDPGRYIFRVKAANKDGVWSQEATTLEVIIAPPYWKTWWFRLGLLGCVLGGVYGLFRFRMRMLIQQKHVLEATVGSRTRELVQQKESVERQKREVEHQKESVEIAHRNISLLSEIGRAITANLDSEAIMQMLYKHVHALMDASVFGIGIYRPEQELIEYPFAMEKGKRYAPYVRSMREPNQLAVWCIQHGKEVFINDLELEYGLYIAHLEHVTSAEDMGTLEDGSLPTAPRSLIYVPITVGGQVRGTITVHSYRPHAYHRIDVDMLTTLASYVGVAFANADSYRKLLDTQQQLVEQEKLAALGALVAGVAHELNTPIGNSLVVASTLEDKTEDIHQLQQTNSLRRSDLVSFIDAAREASTLLMRSLQGAAELVNSFKQVAVDQASAKRRPFNLLQASQEIVTTMRNQIRKAGHSIVLEMPEDIQMDSFPGPYGQVIINLINNTLLHAFEGRSGGEIRLWAVRLGTERVRIVFQDDGKGIAPEHQLRIFDPFFTTKLGQGGNGLGLSITYNIVTSLLDGSIRVDSEVDVGTRFTMDLPLKASKAGD